MNKKKISEKDRAVLLFIQSYRDVYKKGPTLREIKDAVGAKWISTVHSRLARLEQAGLIKTECGKQRSVRVVGRVEKEPGKEEASGVLLKCHFNVPGETLPDGIIALIGAGADGKPVTLYADSVEYLRPAAFGR